MLRRKSTTTLKIDNLDNLTPEQKEDFKKEVDDAAKDAKDKIDNATDKGNVENVKEDGKKAIDNIVDKASKVVNKTTGDKEAKTPSTSDASMIGTSGLMAAIGSVFAALGIKSRKKND